MKLRLVTTICTIASAMMAAAQVPSLINYQGRLTDASGAPVTGSKNFSISIYDAPTAGNLLYTETIGAVSLDANGVYSFQFGGTGTSNSLVTETLATTDAATLFYTKALANTGIVENSITVTDGTNTWSQSAGNPGVGATATANTIAGFVIGATITNGGSGYTSSPAVTIIGNGTGAAATAVLTEGVVTGITITSAGSGYTGTPTITIAPPAIPFRVDYSAGAITATYSAAPTTGAAITASYRYGTNGITGALSSGAEHWMAISVDGTPQATRQRVLAVPFAVKASRAETAATADWAELAQVAQTANTLNPQFKTWRPHPFLNLSASPQSVSYTLPLDVADASKLTAYIPNTFKSLNSVTIKGIIPPANPTYGRTGGIYIDIIKKTGTSSQTIVWSYAKTDVGSFTLSAPINLSIDQNFTYTVSIRGGTESSTISDVLFSVTE